MLKHAVQTLFTLNTGNRNPSFWSAKTETGLHASREATHLREKKVSEVPKNYEQWFHRRLQIPHHFWRSNLAQISRAIYPWHNIPAVSPSPDGTTRSYFVYNSKHSRVENARVAPPQPSLLPAPCLAVVRTSHHGCCGAQSSGDLLHWCYEGQWEMP